MKNKKAVSAVVAISLVLGLAVLAYVFLQNWQINFTEDQISKIDLRLEEGKIQIKEVRDGSLYLNSNYPINVTLKQIRTGERLCRENIEIEPGINVISLETCLLGMSRLDDIVLISDTDFFSKKIPFFGTYIGLDKFGLDIFDLSNDTLYFSSGINDELDSLEIYNGTTLECSFSGSNMPDDDLVGHWNFNDDSKIIEDLSGNGNDGVLYGNSRLLYNFDNASGEIEDLTGYDDDGKLYGDSRLLLDFDETTQKSYDKTAYENDGKYYGYDTKLLMNFDDDPFDKSWDKHDVKVYGDTILSMSFEGDTKDVTGYRNDGKLENSDTALLLHFDKRPDEEFDIIDQLYDNIVLYVNSVPDSVSYDVMDYSSNQKTVTVSTSNPDCRAEGVVGKSCSFNGVDQYLQVAYHSDFSFTDFTISLWAKSNTETWNSDGFFLSKRLHYVFGPQTGNKNVVLYTRHSTDWQGNTVNPLVVDQHH
jgi:hypothetical protein